jgi:hypothetical protein
MILILDEAGPADEKVDSTNEEAGLADVETGLADVEAGPTNVEEDCVAEEGVARAESPDSPTAVGSVELGG